MILNMLKLNSYSVASGFFVLFCFVLFCFLFLFDLFCFVFVFVFVFVLFCCVCVFFFIALSDDLKKKNGHATKRLKKKPLAIENKLRFTASLH